MNAQRGKRYALAAVALALVLCTMYATVYRAQPMDLRLVGPSGEPLAGAYVLVEWELTGGLIEAVPAGILRVTETSSGSDGGVHVPGLGPTWALWYFPARLDVARNPRLTFLKDGYKPVIVNGPDGLQFKAKRPPPGSNEPPALPMAPSPSNAFDYQIAMDGISMEMNDLIRDWGAPWMSCQWKKAPAFTRAFARALEQTNASSPPGRFTDLSSLQGASLQAGCGPLP